MCVHRTHTAFNELFRGYRKRKGPAIAGPLSETITDR
jgi:hypothetical protein